MMQRKDNHAFGVFLSTVTLGVAGVVLLGGILCLPRIQSPLFQILGFFFCIFLVVFPIAMIRRWGYRCWQCKNRLKPVQRDSQQPYRLRYYCKACDILWDTGETEEEIR